MKSTGKFVILSRLNSTTGYAYNDGESISYATTSGTLTADEFPILGLLDSNGPNYLSTDNTHAYDSIGYGFTDAEALMYTNIVSQLQTQLKRA